jgi:hypothetical protein
VRRCRSTSPAPAGDEHTTDERTGDRRGDDAPDVGISQLEKARENE